ncbi:phage holin [Lysinibacillus sp. 54212]|uniref:phage holin n=1 Tax=Lysinibacillus sp. 54212 TaxID=3119829 RepID=UPI002FC6A469
MRINWRVRVRHKTFLVALFSLLLLLSQQVAAIFGYELTAQISEQLTSIFNTILSILVLLGVVVDPTTKGMSDSERACTYERPN